MTGRLTRQDDTHMCDSKELLVGFLYGELDPSEKRTFEVHLGTCAECRDELADLRMTRGQIALWTPPVPDLDFHVARRAAAPPPAPRFRIAPAWGLAAAAVLVMALATAIANVEVRYGHDGLVVRTGWQRAADPTASAPRGGEPNATPVDWKAQADHLDRRLRDLERVMSRNAGSVVPAAAASGLSDAQVLQRVREMLSQSETRQQRAVAARVAEITRDFDAQRRVDLAAIDQGMARLQNTSGAEVKQYRDLIQRMYRATSYQQK